MSDDIPQEEAEWTGGMSSHQTDDPDFYVAFDVTIAQYLRTSDGTTGNGFAFMVMDFDQEPVGNKVITVAMADNDSLPRLLKDLIDTMSCDELKQELLTVINNHKH